MQKLKQKSFSKEAIGTVVSDKMDKTVVVKIGRLMVHPIFKKRIRKFKKFKVHDEKNIAKVGDVVKIHATRPISKGKYWKLSEIITKAL